LGVPDDRIRVIANPVDLGQFDEPCVPGTFRRRAGLPDRKLIVFLGKLTPRKRVDVLARAFAQLSRKDAQLVVAGNDMGYGAELDRLIAALGIHDRTLVAGLLVGRERLDALADADVVVYPSQDEFFGLVPIEAILCGTPVIVADDSGCGEVIGRVGGGLIVRQGSVGDLAAAIDQVLDAPADWRRAADLAGARVRAEFDPAHIAGRVETMYREVMKA
jgi:glycosyltransferase involved in cell wall biosynthesis